MSRFGPRPRPFADRFWEKVDRSGGPDACWPWTAPLQSNGYAKIWNADLGTKVWAHRASLEMQLGHPLTPGLEVLHACDNPRCVNPAHLREGTHTENMAENAERNAEWRANMGPTRARGAAHHAAKVDAETVRAIVAKIEAGEANIPIATAFGVTRDLVNRIRTGRCWSHLTGRSAV